MKKFCIFLGMVLVLSAAAKASEFKLDVQEHTLANGLKILMRVNHSVPRVVCHIYYKVGSINERPGITGIAHVHEHLMFKGTVMMGVNDFAKDDEINRRIDDLMALLYREKYWKKDGDPVRIAALQKDAAALIKEEKQYIIKDDLWETYMKNGGTALNASTSEEVTGYYVTLPANKVELQMLLEADRMKNAYWREFYSEKDVVMEERRLSENSPGYLFQEQVNAAFFTSSPYHWGVIGWMDDLRRMTKKDMQEFHDRFYVPNNAVAVYVGDIDPQRIISLAEKYLGAVPRGSDTEPIRTGEVPQGSEKRLFGEGPAASSVALLFHIPADGHPDVYPLAILVETLSGETGRLYSSLIKEKDLAVRVSAFSRPQWYAGQLTVTAYPKVFKGTTPEMLETEIWQELEKIKQAGVKPDELQKAKNKLEARLIMSLQTPMVAAMRIGRAELNRGWRSLVNDLAELKKVTSDDVKAVASRYLVRTNATVAIFKRKLGN